MLYPHKIAWILLLIKKLKHWVTHAVGSKKFKTCSPSFLCDIRVIENLINLSQKHNTWYLGLCVIQSLKKSTSMP